MTENQEKELFKTLATLVTGVNAIQSDLSGIKTDVQGLKTDVHVLKTDVQGLKTDVHELKTDVQGLKTDVHELKTDVRGLKTDVREIKVTLKEHSQILNRLEAKTDSIASTVINHEKRLTKLEKEAEESRDRIH